MPAGVYACDRDGVITYYNPQAVEIWGHTPNLDDPPWSFLDPRRVYGADGIALAPEGTPMRRVLATGVAVVNCELVLERPDLSRIHVPANITPLRDASGAFTGALSIFQDIDELKRNQQEREMLLHELERSSREFSQFSYAVSHDLQAPVRGVRALTQLLVRRNENLRDDSAHLLTLIDPATSGMERLIDSLLRYSHAGQGQLSRERVKTDQIIEGVRTTLAPLITKTRARIVCGPLPAVDADPVLRNWGSRILFLTRSCITAPVLPTIRIGFLNR